MILTVFAICAILIIVAVLVAAAASGVIEEDRS